MAGVEHDEGVDKSKRVILEENVGLKFDGDKPRMDLLDSYAIEQLSLVLTFGARKYAPENWRKGIGTRRLIAAALRHLFALLRGEDLDPETGLSHASHAMCCCMFIIWMIRHNRQWDDRRSGTSSEEVTQGIEDFLRGFGDKKDE